MFDKFINACYKIKSFAELPKDVRTFSENVIDIYEEDMNELFETPIIKKVYPVISYYRSIKKLPSYMKADLSYRIALFSLQNDIKNFLPSNLNNALLSALSYYPLMRLGETEACNKFVERVNIGKETNEHILFNKIIERLKLDPSSIKELTKDLIDCMKVDEPIYIKEEKVSGWISNFIG